MNVITLVVILLLIVALIKSGWDIMRLIDDGDILNVIFNAFYAAVVFMIIIVLI